jgi:hypothetical protein
MATGLPGQHPFRDVILRFDELSPAATKYRYPSPGGRIADPPPAEDIQRALEALSALPDEAKGFVSRLPGHP